jgi:hypothetical protein
MTPSLTRLLSLVRLVEDRLLLEESYTPENALNRGTSAEYLLLALRKARKEVEADAASTISLNADDGGHGEILATIADRMQDETVTPHGQRVPRSE